MKDIKKPKSKLPLSPRKSLGKFKSEKLKNKKIKVGIIINNRKN